MRTRNTKSFKPAPAVKKTPPPKKVKTDKSTANPNSDTKPEPQVEEAEASADVVEVTPETKPVSGKKKITRVVKKKVVRKKTPTSAKNASSGTPNSGDAGNGDIEESSKTEEVENAIGEESVKNKEVILVNVEESEKTEENPVEHVEESVKQDYNVPNDDKPATMKELPGVPLPLVEDVGTSSKEEDPVLMEVANSLDIQEPRMVKEDEETKEVMEKTEIVEDKMEIICEPVNIEENISEELRGDQPSKEEDMGHRDEMVGHGGQDKELANVVSEPVNIEEKISEELGGDDSSKEEDVGHGDEEMVGHGGQDKELGEEELAKDNVTEHGEKAQRSEEERAEVTALVKERKIRKELEIFVSGLDGDAVDEDVKKVFRHIGEVVEVRVHKDPSNTKNKGYAFVKFATKEHATRALAEMRNPVINGKRCGTAPSEDNDTLFLGNICNTWTKEAIRQKLKDYGIEDLKNITLVSDPRREGLSRGFAFIEFSCHGDAMLAYKRLQKPDVIFGHPERTAKVAFAEPLSEPDPDVLAQVKSVFIDGLPPHWDEDHVRKLFKGYGEIERITLAQNMATSKRKDFGFVDFTTHEAAVACIDDINIRKLDDGNSKAKVRARLSNPLPKTQAIKGEMRGGFRIGRANTGTLPHSGRGFGQGGRPFDSTNFQRGRGFYHHGRGQSSRMGFANDRELADPFRGRQSFGQGGRWGSFRGAHQAYGGGTMPARFNLDRPRHDAIDRGYERHMHLRGQPYAPEEFNRPFLGRHYDDPYFYDDSAHGIKRPFFNDRDPSYMEPTRVRPRLDYFNPSVSTRGTHYRDTSGAGSSRYAHDYHGSNYNGDTYSSFHGGDRPYRGGYYH